MWRQLECRSVAQTLPPWTKGVVLILVSELGDDDEDDSDLHAQVEDLEEVYDGSRMAKGEIYLTDRKYFLLLD